MGDEATETPRVSVARTSKNLGFCRAGAVLGRRKPREFRNKKLGPLRPGGNEILQLQMRQALAANGCCATRTETRSKSFSVVVVASPASSIAKFGRSPVTAP